MKISFIGIGIMGSRMATNLLQSGVGLTIYNRSEAPRKKLKEIGAREATSLKEALSDADIVFTMLSKPEVIAELMLTAGLQDMKQNALWVDCSTVNPSFTQKASKVAKREGIRYLEAPVAGSSPQAEAAELVILVGGEERELNEAKPYLEMMGQKVLHLGAVGKGASFKLVINVMLATGMVAFAEALKFGESMGLDKEFLLKTIPNLAVSPPFTKMKAEVIKEGNYHPQFPLELLYKDLHLAAQTAYENDQALPYATMAKELYAMAMNQGLGRKDMAAVYKFLDK
ncbi:MAG: NAD(P)-dependent oxidoreductase [Bacteroidota bacterium]